MPKFSAFTPFGMLAFSSKPSRAESIYNSLANQFTDSGISVDPGSREDCTLYAQAMGMARARYCLEKAWNQILPNKVTDLLDQHEADYGIVPGPTQTTDQRRGALVARKLLPLGAARNNVENALRALLGTDLLAYRTTTAGEGVSTPTNSTDQPLNFQLATVAPKLVTLASDISVGLGAPQTVGYAKVALPLHPGLSPSANYIQAGDKLVVEAGRFSLEEVVTVTASTSSTFTATFNNAHQAGAYCTTQPWPAWSSTQRHALIVLTASAAVDPVKRQAIHDIMGRIARGVSTWAIVASTGTGTAGPFVIGSSPIGATPLGTISYT
jgi:hypothetical protein